MDISALEDKLLKVITQNDAGLLHQFVARMLQADRESSLAFFDSFVERIVSRNRQKFLEALMEDGGQDLIPIFIKALKEEKNVLYAKSILFLYGYFEYPEALIALQEIEENIHFDLVKPYQKICANMKSKFRELFYMDEFKMGSRNPKRMNHAARKMIETPNPAYIPFLNEMVHSRDPYLQRTAIKTTAELGDHSSLDVMLAMLPGLFTHHERADDLSRFLTSERTWQVKKLSWFVATMGKIAGWDDEATAGAEVLIKTEKSQKVVEQINESVLLLDIPVRTDINGFLEMIFSGGTPQESHLKRVERLFGDYLEDLTSRLQNVFKTLGRLGDRLKIDNLHDRVKAEIPDGNETAESLMITFMGGYRSEESLNKLIESLSPDSDPKVLEKILTSLAEYKLDTLPPQLRVLALDNNTGHLRKQVLRIIAESGLLDELVDELLDHPTISVRTEAFSIISEFQNENGYKKLIAMLDPDLSPRVLELLIQALETFPRTETGEAAAPYLLPPCQYLVRAAALRTIYLAGGPTRMHLIVTGIQKYPEAKRPEIIDSFFKLHQAENQPIEMLAHPEFWALMLNETKNEDLRQRSITILEQADWTQCRHEDWPKTFQEAHDNADVKRDSKEQRQLRVLMLKARAGLTRHQEDEAEAKAQEDATTLAVQRQTEKQAAAKTPEAPQITVNANPHLATLLEKLEHQQLAERVKGFRILNLRFKPDWVQENDPAFERTIRAIRKMFRDHTGSNDMIKIGISLAAKIRDQRLLDEVKTVLANGDNDLLEYARKALTHGAQQATRGIQRILILDDTMLITKTLTRSLNKAGFETMGFIKPEDALQQLQKNRFDLLILDFMMPGQTGLNFLNHLRGLNLAPQHVLWISSSRDDGDVAQMRSTQSDGILHKPFNINALLDRINGMKVAA
ncbi:MAG: response regulator [Acidobacteriota bacterium]|nr:response regulator [Acidobacteriota bacterium]